MTYAVMEPQYAGSGIASVFSNPAMGARRIEVAADTLLFDPGTPADQLYLVESGEVRLYQMGPDQSARLSEILGPGDWFGIAALAGGGSYFTRAVTVSSSTLWVLAAEDVFKLLRRETGIALEMIGQLASRLQAANEDAARLMFDDCNQRLIDTLVRFSRSAAATPQDDGGVVLRITHQQLAQAVGAARETISLALTQLRQQNLLKTGRNRLFFKPETLREFGSRPRSREKSSERELN